MTSHEHEHSARAVLHRPSHGQLAWITILVLVGIVQVVREQPFDVVLFAVATLVTTLDATGLLGAPSTARRFSGRALIGAGAVCAASIALLPRRSPAMMGVMLLMAAAVVVLVWPGRGIPNRWMPGLRPLAWCWAVILVVGCLWELFAFVIQLIDPSMPGLALSDLLNPVLGLPLGQAAFAVAWTALGVWLVDRTVRR